MERIAFQPYRRSTHSLVDAHAPKMPTPTAKGYDAPCSGSQSARYATEPKKQASENWMIMGMMNSLAGALPIFKE